jgi:DMSO reductase anchor subunit
MRPAISIVFFTVSSGAGLGLMVLMTLLSSLSAVHWSTQQQRIGGACAIVLVVAGLCASTLHLASPQRAWRAFIRVRTSWLSREAVLAVLVLPLAALWTWPGLLSQSVHAALGAVLAVLALLLIFSTAMIYASLKPIRQWHTPLTPLVYLSAALASGGLLTVWLTQLEGASAQTGLVFVTLLALASTALCKLAYWMRAARMDGSTVQDALGLQSAAQIKLLDAGHTHRTFLTDEFIFRMARAHVQTLTVMFWLAGLLLPAWLMVWFPQAALTAACSCLLGLLAERWLFFAQARHTVQLYHGATRV